MLLLIQRYHLLGSSPRRLREAAKQRAEKQAETARHEVGGIVLDATYEYFAKEMRARRRRDVARGFVAGVGLGVAVGYAMGR